MVHGTERARIEEFPVPSIAVCGGLFQRASARPLSDSHCGVKGSIPKQNPSADQSAVGRSRIESLAELHGLPRTQ